MLVLMQKLNKLFSKVPPFHYHVTYTLLLCFTPVDRHISSFIFAQTKSVSAPPAVQGAKGTSAPHPQLCDAAQLKTNVDNPINPAVAS